jgi:hypothetical protein
MMNLKKNLYVAAMITIAAGMTVSMQSCVNEDNSSAPVVEEEAVRIASFDFMNNTANWPTSADALDETGAVKTLTVDGVVLTSIQGDSFYPNVILKDENRGIVFWVRRNTSFKLTAPEGKALTQIAVTMQTGNFDLTPSTGSIADNTWTGNATEVTFAASAARYLWKIEVTLADENDDTVKPAEITVDAEAATIAEFNAIEDGKLVKLSLKNARVNAKMGNIYFVEDATGATELPADLNLTIGTLLNGDVVGVKASEDADMNGDIKAHKLTATEQTNANNIKATAGEMTGMPATIATAATQENLGRLIQLTDVTIEKTGRFWYVKNGDDQIQLYDGLSIYDFGYEDWPAKAKSVTGVVYYNVVRWAIMPTSTQSIVAD